MGRALNSKAIVVLRFDFTGLGESEGDFQNTNFSSNIEGNQCRANKGSKFDVSPISDF